jgi:hypothetical protein
MRLNALPETGADPAAPEIRADTDPGPPHAGLASQELGFVATEPDRLTVHDRDQPERAQPAGSHPALMDQNGGRPDVVGVGEWIKPQRQRFRISVAEGSDPHTH